MNMSRNALRCKTHTIAVTQVMMQVVTKENKVSVTAICHMNVRCGQGL